MLPHRIHHQKEPSAKQKSSWSQNDSTGLNATFLLAAKAATGFRYGQIPVMFDVLFQKIAVNHVRFSQNQNRKNKP
jgi:hypothetical protein